VFFYEPTLAKSFFSFYTNEKKFYSLLFQRNGAYWAAVNRFLAIAITAIFSYDN